MDHSWIHLPALQCSRETGWGNHPTAALMTVRLAFRFRSGFGRRTHAGRRSLPLGNAGLRASFWRVRRCTRRDPLIRTRFPVTRPSALSRVRVPGADRRSPMLLGGENRKRPGVRMPREQGIMRLALVSPKSDNLAHTCLRRTQVQGTQPCKPQGMRSICCCRKA